MENCTRSAGSKWHRAAEGAKCSQRFSVDLPKAFFSVPVCPDSESGFAFSFHYPILNMHTSVTIIVKQFHQDSQKQPWVFASDIRKCTVTICWCCAPTEEQREMWRRHRSSVESILPQNVIKQVFVREWLTLLGREITVEGKSLPQNSWDTPKHPKNL